MTKEEFNRIDWRRGNVAKLENGKEYLVKGTKAHGRYLLLYSLEYDSYFVADHYIVVGRTSDYAEPEEVYLEHKRKKQEEARARLDAIRQELRRQKEERKRRNLEEQERIHQEALARKAARIKANEAKKSAKPAKEPKAKPVAQPAKEPVAKPASSEAPKADAPKPKRKRIRIFKKIEY